jgi:signal transduction histidine kinase/ligand-binding sensor domain-containing protein/DNA-binding response OmpR family regulator
MVTKLILDICKMLCIFVFLTALSYSQNNTGFEKFSTEQGLSQNSIMRIYQDSRGFLWICTLDGLNRYDGYQFKIFRNIPGDSTSLSNNKIISVCEDKSGNIWIGTYGGGLNKYDRKQEKFKRYVFEINNPNSLSGNIVTSIIQDKSGNLWLGTYGGGLNKFDIEEEKFIHYMYDISNKNSISNNTVLSIYKDRSGIVWIGTYGGGLNRLDPKSDVFNHFKSDKNNSHSISSNIISSILEDKSGKIWVGTIEGGLNVFSPPANMSSTEDGNYGIVFYHFKNEPKNKNSISSNGILSIYQDIWENIWIGTDGGGLNKLVLQYNFSEKIQLPSEYKNIGNEDFQFLHFKNDPNDVLSISDNRVWSIHEDKSGILWIGTNSGLNKLDVQKKQFKHYSYDPVNPGSLSDGDVSSIIVDNSDNLWIGTGSGGLNLYDAKEDRFTKYIHDTDNPNSLSNDEVFSLFQDKEGNLWIGTYGGLIKLNSEYISEINKNKSPPTFISYKHNPEDPNSLSDNRVYSILEDKSGNLWIGTLDGGLNRLLPDSIDEDNKSSPIFQHYRHLPDNPASLSSDRVFSIFEDSRGTLWIGTWGGGLNKLQLNDNSDAAFIHYKNDPDNPNSLSDNGVASIFEDHAGNLWIGTYGGGLNKFDGENEIFSHYTENDGLSNNVVLGILEDEKGNLWLSTIKGLNKFDPINETFSHFDVRDGLLGNEFSLGVHKSKNGEMYFGGIKGFNKFHPDSIKDIAYVSPIIITDFKIFNRSVPIGIDSSNNRSILSQSICETEQIDLTYEDYVISFEFASLDFHVPEKINYLYMMEGFDKQWNLTDASRRYATYTNLDPGDYIFKVKRANINGSGNEASASIKINVHPPWWKTIWAYLLYAFLIIGSSLLLWGLQIRRMHLRHEMEMSKFEAKKLHEVDEMKSTFFANISHEFRTPLTLILNPVKDLVKTEKDAGRKEELNRIHRNADMLYGLVNQLMDLSKLEAGKMTLKTCEENIVQILKGLVLSFASLAERKNITLKFDSTDEKIVTFIDIEKLEKIVINILSNAFKFTSEGGEISVSISLPTFKSSSGRSINGLGLVSSVVQIIIRDTGIGIPKERLENIFDRFYQVDSSHTREHEGTGIGLALTKELVDLHKGEIEVESDEGKGTTFIVRLPLGKNHLKPEEVCEEIREQEKEIVIPQSAQIFDDAEQGITKLDINVIVHQDKPLLLIVEDNIDVRNYVKGHLENDYRIMAAANGEDGVNKALEHIPDLIISDVMMPKMDGFELCEKVKTDERTSHIPVILLTAKATGEDKIEGLETGADDYIMKPFDAKILQVRVKNLIEQRKKIVDHYRKKQLFDISEIDAASTDKKFLNRALEIINNHISDEDFSVESFAKEIALSRVQLHRKLVALIGHAPGDFIRIVRLTKAGRLIRCNFGNISEIALEVGFSNPANFAKAFRVQFGVSPTEYRNKFEN